MSNETPIFTSPFRFTLLLLSVALQFALGFSDDSSSKAGKETKGKGSSTRSTGSHVAIVLLVLAVVVVLSFFLFKFWQKKKREKQYARLLKLFEEDDELEVELGLRD